LEFFQDNLLTSSLDKTSRIYGTKSGRLLQEFKAHDRLINAATWVNDGSKVLTGCSSGEVIAFSRSTGTPIQAFTIVRTSDTLGDPSVRGIRVIQSKNGTSTLMIYTLRDAHETTIDGKLIQSYRSGNADTYIGCDISPTGSTVYLATERGSVHVFNRKSGALIRELRSSDRGLTAIRLSEAGLLLAVSSLDGKIDLFG
jgi:WD40 repeat-containing protein SMU1